jgi:hypothetical protein
VESETSDIKGHLVETKTSCSQIETAPSYIEYHQSPSKPEKRLVPNWEQTVASSGSVRLREAKGLNNAFPDLLSTLKIDPRDNLSQTSTLFQYFLGQALLILSATQ